MVRPKPHPPPPDYFRLDWLAGVGIRDLMGMYGCSRYRVAELVRDLGLPPRWYRRWEVWTVDSVRPLSDLIAW